tara:strand:+ start:318 stop:716 length:399 start_codon:yes stop_codon:yes gene_type:complete
MAAYAYKPKGRKIELLELDVFNYWVTPQVDKTLGLKIEFTKRAKINNPATDAEWNEAVLGGDGPIDESAIIDLPDYLAKALVYYLKARILEDQQELEAREYYMHQFQKMIDTHEENKTGGMSQTMVGNWGIK